MRMKSMFLGAAAMLLAAPASAAQVTVTPAALETAERCIAEYGATFTRSVYDSFGYDCRSVAFPPIPRIVGLKTDGYPKTVRQGPWGIGAAYVAVLHQQCSKNSSANDACAALLGR